MQPSEEFEQNNFDRIQCALDIVHTIDELEYPLQSRSSTPKDTALLILEAACKFYDADWCGLIQVDLDLRLWTPFWWHNTGVEDKTTILTEEFESADFLDRWVLAIRKNLPMVVPDTTVVRILTLQSTTYISVSVLSLSWLFHWNHVPLLCLRYETLNAISIKPVCFVFLHTFYLLPIMNKKC